MSQILQKWAVTHIHWNNPNVAGVPQTLFPVSKAEKLPLVCDPTKQMGCLDTILANLEVSQLLMGSGRQSSMPPWHFLHPLHVIPRLPHNVIVIQCTTLWTFQSQRILSKVCTPGDKMLSKTPISAISWFITTILLSAGHYSCERKSHYLNNRHCLTQKPKRNTSSHFCDRILFSLSFEFSKELFVILYQGKEKRKGLDAGW